MPDVDAYAAAVSGRALATKCRGGYIRNPSAEKIWLTRFVSGLPSSRNAATATSPHPWGGESFATLFVSRSNDFSLAANLYYSMTAEELFNPLTNIPGFVEGSIYQITIGDPYSLVGTPPFHPTSNAPFEDAGSPFPLSRLVANSQWYLFGYSLISPTPLNAAFAPVQLEASFSIYLRSDVTSRARSWHNPANPRVPYRAFDLRPTLERGAVHEKRLQSGRTVSYLGISQTYSSSPGITDVSRRVNPFDFYGRLEGGVGSVLEVDSDDNQTEVQTVSLTCRYDSRFEVGDWITIGDLPDFNFQIQSIDNIGRQKWQSLTLVQRSAL